MLTPPPDACSSFDDDGPPLPPGMVTTPRLLPRLTGRSSFLVAAVVEVVALYPPQPALTLV